MERYGATSKFKHVSGWIGKEMVLVLHISDEVARLTNTTQVLL
jgi:hypothetical protein